MRLLPAFLFSQPKSLSPCSSSSCYKSSCTAAVGVRAVGKAAVAAAPPGQSDASAFSDVCFRPTVIHGDFVSSNAYGQHLSSGVAAGGGRRRRIAKEFSCSVVRNSNSGPLKLGRGWCPAGLGGNRRLFNQFTHSGRWKISLSEAAGDGGRCSSSSFITSFCHPFTKKSSCGLFVPAVKIEASNCAAGAAAISEEAGLGEREGSSAPAGTGTAVMERRVESVKKTLSRLFKDTIDASIPQVVGVEPLVEVCKNASFGDYQCNNAMGIWSQVKKATPPPFKNPNAIGQTIAKDLPKNSVISSTSIAGPGFINIKLSTTWIEERIVRMLIDGVDTWAPSLPVTRALVDFSSPNIAKEMHVGHLRSTIIGESICRMLEFCHVEVLRRNHVGDWGTQFGMLIEFLFEQFPNWEDIGEQAIGDLQDFYRRAKVKFDSDPVFKTTAQRAVVLLQGGDETYRAAWAKICDISRIEFKAVYERLNVSIEERGESFYNPYIASTLEQLTQKGLVEDSKGARVIKVDGYEIPLIVVKSDGGYNYASTDLAALSYRLNVERAEWIIYITDAGQQQHFNMVFSAAKRAGWLRDDVLIPKAKHLGFGLVLGSDGKRFRTRSTEVVRLTDLLDEAKNRSKQELINRGKATGWSSEEVEAAADALGYGAVKYADLKNNRLTNYTFNFDQMLDVRGNTAVYLLYAHARICSILRNSEKSVDELMAANASISLSHSSERQLGLHLIQFSEIIEDSLVDFLPNTLCEYLYNLAERFTDFYTNCKVLGSEEESSRLLLCEATAVVMRQCFKLLGITPLYRL